MGHSQPNSKEVSTTSGKLRHFIKNDLSASQSSGYHYEIIIHLTGKMSAVTEVTQVRRPSGSAQPSAIRVYQIAGEAEYSRMAS